jgi:hypothetical protein
MRLEVLEPLEPNLPPKSDRQYKVDFSARSERRAGENRPPVAGSLNEWRQPATTPGLGSRGEDAAPSQAGCFVKRTPTPQRARRVKGGEEPIGAHNSTQESNRS